MKKILITTDLSEESQIAFNAARDLASAFDAELILLAIVEDPAQAAMIYALDFPVQPDMEVQTQMQEKLNKDLEELAKQHFSGINVRSLVVAAEGPVHSEIISFAKKEAVDLIVMSTHGRTGISRMLIGSITERVVREAPCAILTVPGKEKKSGIFAKITPQQKNSE